MMTLLLIIIYISFISLGLPDSLLGSAWPVMYGELQVPVSFAGIISMIIAGGTIISSFFSEKIIRRLGTGPVTAISVFMTAAALLGFSLSHSAWLLCVLAVPYGLGAGSVDAALNNFVALHYKAHHMSWLHCFWGIGATAGPFIMSLCLNTGKSWHSGYMTIALIQIILTVFLFLSLPLWKKQQAGTATEENGAQNTSLSFSRVLQLPGAKPALLCFFGYCALEASAGLWGSSYFVLAKGIPAEKAAQWTSLFYFGITFGRFISGFLSMFVACLYSASPAVPFLSAGDISLSAWAALPSIPAFSMPRPRISAVNIPRLLWESRWPAPTWEAPLCRLYSASSPNM